MRITLMIIIVVAGLLALGWGTGWIGTANHRPVRHGAQSSYAPDPPVTNRAPQTP